MKTFYLKPKNSKEVISRVLLETLEEAIIYFSKVKKQHTLYVAFLYNQFI
jgi:hypothetical protein